MVLGVTVPIGEVGVLLEQMTAVGKQDGAEIAGRLGADDRSPESVFGQQRKIPGVVEMGMGQDDGLDLFWVDRKRRPVAQTQLLEALKQAAIDQDAMLVRFDQIFRARYGADTAKERQFECHR